MPRPEHPNGTIEWVESFDPDALCKCVGLIHRSENGRIRKIKSKLSMELMDDMSSMGIDAVQEVKRMLLQNLRDDLRRYSETEPIFPEWFFDPCWIEPRQGFAAVDWLREGF